METIEIEAKENDQASRGGLIMGGRYSCMTFNIPQSYQTTGSSMECLWGRNTDRR
jgi:hypothetical protein